MTTVAQGSSVTLEAQFFEYAGGPPEDITGLTVKIVPVSSSTPILGPTSSGIGHPATGLYNYSWSVSGSQTVGDYTVVWEGTDASLEAVQASEVVMVVVGSTGAWATTSQVFATTGATVSQTVVNQAQGIIDLFSGVPYTGSAAVSGRDRYWLPLAVSYEAAWLPRQPDLIGRMDFTTLTQDGNVIGLTPDATLLAPAARRALKKVSWLKSRALHVKSPFQDGNGVVSANPLAEANDDDYAWSPMGG